MTVVRAAITQTTWTGDKESMIAKHEQFARDAAADGAKIICFQQIMHGYQKVMFSITSVAYTLILLKRYQNTNSSGVDRNVSGNNLLFAWINLGRDMVAEQISVPPRGLVQIL